MSPIPFDPRVTELETKLAESERFATSVAHELKGALATLVQYTRGLGSATAVGDSERLQHDVGRIQQIARDLAETVDALLLDAKNGPGFSSQETASLHQAALQAVELLQESLDAAQIDVIVSSDLPAARGPSVLWRQVFRNLIDNAMKACTGIKQPRIEICCEQRDGETVCFVRDNGQGISGDDPQRLFRAGTYPGHRPETGFGLQFVQRIIERSGGRIWAERSARGTAVLWTVINK